jgi:phosphoribosylformylglycinamidine cyclo-ligase
VSDREPLTYADAGVSLDAAEGVVERIRTAVESTRTGSVLGGVGGFAGLFAPSLADPLLAAGCDGVGTKVLLGKAAGRLPGLGVDLVAMCVNDVITSGARPAFFLDVMTCGTGGGHRRRLPAGSVRAAGRRDGGAPRHDGCR